MVEAIARYAHFIGIMLLTSMLVAENILLTSRLKVGAIKTVAKIDGLYGLGAVITLGAGLFLWLVVGKPEAFYSQNIIFHIKIGLFFLVAFISIFPTVFLLKNRHNQIGAISVPVKIILVKRFELLIICIMPLLATLIAQGIGFSK